MDIIVKDFIFCDDIRLEEGGKFSIMGIYTEELKILSSSNNKLNYRVPLSAFLSFKSKRKVLKERFNLKLDISFEETPLAEIETEIIFKSGNYAILPLRRFEVDIEKSGILTVKIKLLNKQQESILNYKESLKFLIESTVNPAQTKLKKPRL